MNASFDTLYHDLNEAQKAAVDQIYGPVMVIAGPGTGKTQILAARILNILQKTDASPSNILCLTYTEAGATAMHQRLSQFMGSEAYKVNVHTFHGLCNRVIQENPQRFSKRELRVMDDLERIQLIQDIVDGLPSDSPIKSYADNPAHLRRSLKQLWDIMQSEDLQAETLQQWVRELSDEEAYKLAFPEEVYKRKTGEFQAGDLKRNKYISKHENWIKLTEAASLYPQYQALKKERGVYEFADMIDWVVKAWAEADDLLLDYKEQFQFVLVDEYQDTSGMQNQLLFSLIEDTDLNPNCFVVGDDDQSIYAFQGAEVSNMQHFAKTYREAGTLTTVMLTENYRSSQSILDASRGLIEHNQQRLVNQNPGLSKILSAAGKNKAFAQHAPTVERFTHEFHEACGIAHRIQELKEQGVPLKEIAVLYAQHKHANALLDLLPTLGIDAVQTRSMDALQEPLVQHLLRWLEYLALESEMANAGDHLLYRLLLSPLYQVDPYELNQLSMFLAEQNRHSSGPGQSWRDALAEIAKNKPESPFAQLHRNIEEWIKLCTMGTVPQLLQSLYNQGQFIQFGFQQSSPEWALEVLESFLEFAANQTRRQPFQPLSAFLLTVKLMEENDIRIPIQKRIGTQEGVQLLTAHGSKGLEFDHVFIIRANESSWEKERNRAMPYELSSLLEGHQRKLNHQSAPEEAFEERRRLFFVAMTRARKQLHCSFINQTASGAEKAQKPSVFIFNAFSEVPEDPVVLPLSLNRWAAEQRLRLQSKPRLDAEKLDWIRNRMEGFRYSPSSIHQLLECGIQFYFNRVVRVPSAPNEHAAFGTAIHNALSDWVKNGQEGLWWKAEELVQSFEKEMLYQRHAFSKKQFEKRLDQGRQMLPKYFELRKEEFEAETMVLTEKSLQAVIGGIPVSGKSDKLIFRGNQVSIVDYKTGNARKLGDKSKAPSKLDLEKVPHSHWFQLGVYTLLVNEQTQKDWKAEMAYLEGVLPDEMGEFHRHKIHYTAEHLDWIQAWMQHAVEQVNSLAFLSGCGKCDWCEFAKSSGQSALPSLDEEESMGG